MSAPRLNLYDLTREQLRLQLVRWELNPVHVARLWNYLYIELAASLEAMTELPRNSARASPPRRTSESCQRRSRPPPATASRTNTSSPSATRRKSRPCSCVSPAA